MSDDLMTTQERAAALADDGGLWGAENLDVEDADVIFDGLRLLAAFPPEPTPEMIAAAWAAFRGDRRDRLLGPGPAFKEVITAALGVINRPSSNPSFADRSAAQMQRGQHHDFSDQETER